MVDIKSTGTDRWTTGKGGIQDRHTDRVTFAREGAEQKIHFSLDFHPLHNLQE